MTKENSNPNEKYIYPFVALGGQVDMKTALILNAIDPQIGGVMLMGGRGTEISTTIRAFRDVLPLIKVIKGDEYNSLPKTDTPSADIEVKNVPLVDLPLGATEDRVCGSIDTQQALEGNTVFEPGLLAKANRGILYVDEVNLLEESLVNVLLDAAASGRNNVEREGISHKHPADFVLIGSGNPEEGKLCPQLRPKHSHVFPRSSALVLECFGMCVDVGRSLTSEALERKTKNRTEFDNDPESFCKKMQENQLMLRELIELSRQILPNLELQDYQLSLIGTMCKALKLNGLRGDMVIQRSACALAAFRLAFQLQFPKTCSFPKRGPVVDTMDILDIAYHCVRHRLPKYGKTKNDIIENFCRIASETALNYGRAYKDKYAECYPLYYQLLNTFGRWYYYGGAAGKGMYESVGYFTYIQGANGPFVETRFMVMFDHFPGFEFIYLEGKEALGSLPKTLVPGTSTYANETPRIYHYLHGEQTVESMLIPIGEKNHPMVYIPNKQYALWGVNIYELGLWRL